MEDFYGKVIAAHQAGLAEYRQQKQLEQQMEEHDLNVKIKKHELDTANINRALLQKQLDATVSGGPPQQFPQNIQELLTQSRQQAQPQMAPIPSDLNGGTTTPQNLAPPQVTPLPPATANPPNPPDIVIPLSDGTTFRVPRQNLENTNAQAALANYQAAQQAAQAAGMKAGAEARAKAPTEFHAMGAEGGVLGAGTPSQQVFPGKAETPKAPEVKSENGVPMAVSDGRQTFGIGDPQMPASWAKIADIAVKKHQEYIQQQADIADKLNARQEARAEAASARAQAIADSKAPDTIKTQMFGAALTKDTVGTIRDAVKARPQIVGPVAGKLEAVYQGLGTSFGFQNPADEQAASDLANTLGNLVVNESRTGFSRSSPQAAALIKSFSAQLKDNPNMLEGFLKGADRQADNVLNTGKQWGIKMERNAAPSPSGKRPPLSSFEHK